jgi:hypothetical protein
MPVSVDKIEEVECSICSARVYEKEASCWNNDDCVDKSKETDCSNTSLEYSYDKKRRLFAVDLNVAATESDANIKK